MTQRIDGRRPDELRPIRLEVGFIRQNPASVLIATGLTRVLCTATVEDAQPAFLRATERGWVTAEYGMLPGSSRERIARRVGGRTQEIQRLIGRSLRAVTDLDALGPRTVWVDCDVLEADGGTRTAAITGGYVALALACRGLREAGALARDPLRDAVAAVSVGICEGEILVDLCYAEDSTAEVDMNVVMTGAGHYVEVQGTAEGAPFSPAQLDALTAAAAAAIAELAAAQRAALG